MTAFPSIQWIKMRSRQVFQTHRQVQSLTAMCIQCVQTWMYLDHWGDAEVTGRGSQKPTFHIENGQNCQNVLVRNSVLGPCSISAALCTPLKCHYRNKLWTHQVNRIQWGEWKGEMIIAVPNGEVRHRQWVAMYGWWYPGDLTVFTT